MDGDVTVRVEYSTLNYKDGLAITGKAPVVRRFPMIAGIDFAGTVEVLERSGLEAGRQGDPQRLGPGRDPSRRLCREGARQRRAGWCGCRQSMSAREAMAIGTAGYTAMLCVMALERHGLTPALGPVAVTGAAGGVGSVAVAILAKLRLYRPRGDRAHAGSRLSQRPGRRRDRRAQGAGRPAQAARQGALGGRRRCGRFRRARQSVVDDALWRGGSRLWIGRRYGPAGFGRARLFCGGCVFTASIPSCAPSSGGRRPGNGWKPIWTGKNWPP